jgi:hypothetical protein
MQPSGIIEQRAIVPRNWLVRPTMPVLVRFLGKFVLDVMPAALASLIGGYLLTHYQLGFTTASRPVAVQVTPASAEMMALVRDEHAMIIDYLKTQIAAEKSRQAAEDADERDAADAQPADLKPADARVDARLDARLALEASARRLAASVASKSPAPRAKVVPAVAVAAVTVPHAPLVIAQAQQNTTPDDAASAGRLARDPNSLLAKTLDLKDHVVAATRHVVGVIGDMFASVGERITGPAVSGRQFSSDS